MNGDQDLQSKITARDAATRLLNRLTAGIAMGAIAGLGVLGVVSAATIPGSSSSTTTTALAAGVMSSASTSSSISSSNSSSSSTSSSSLSSSGSVSSTTGSGVAVTGGS